MVNGVIDEIDSMVSEVVKLPVEEHNNALMNIVSKMSEKYSGALEYDTIINFVNESYDSKKYE